jgi:hypothetical protein
VGVGWQRRRPRVWVGALAAAVVAAGCGSGGESTPTGPATALPSYLARYSPGRGEAVYFIQWQRRGESVEGTLTVVVPRAADTPSQTQGLTGDIDGRRVTLDVGSEPSQRWEGERNGRAIVFRVDLVEGSVQTLRFVPAKLAAFRRAVAEARMRG